MGLEQARRGRAEVRQGNQRSARVVEDDPGKLPARSRQPFRTELAVDAAEVATIRLEEHARAALLDAEHRRRTDRQGSGGVEQALPLVRRTEMDGELLVHRPLDRDVPPSRAAGARVSAEVGRVDAQAKGGFLLHRVFQFVNRITETDWSKARNTTKKHEIHGVAPARELLF